jgi:hypothetical protein
LELTEQARRAVSILEDAVKPDGWCVSTSVVGRSVRVALEHALSTPHSFNFPNDDQSHVRFVREALSHSEFAKVARRPTPVQHPELLQSLRAAATANMWGPDVLEAVARVLEANGILAESESMWLEQSGRTW